MKMLALQIMSTSNYICLHFGDIKEVTHSNFGSFLTSWTDNRTLRLWTPVFVLALPAWIT